MLAATFAAESAKADPCTAFFVILFLASLWVVPWAWKHYMMTNHTDAYFRHQEFEAERKRRKAEAKWSVFGAIFRGFFR